MTRKSIGQRIADRRRLLGLSQSDLARRLGVFPQAVQKWEQGGNPRAQRIPEIAEVLGMAPEELVSDAPGEATTAESRFRWPFSTPLGVIEALRPDDAGTLDKMMSSFVASTLARYRNEEKGTNLPLNRETRRRVTRSTMDSLDEAVEAAKGAVSGSTNHGRAAAAPKRGGGSR